MNWLPFPPYKVKIYLMSTTYDIIIWGATGFTGKLVAEYITERYGANGRVRWAIAGRNLQKLEQVRANLAKIDAAAADLPLLLADSLDKESLHNLVKQTEVICSTVGPYISYGTPLVEVCAEQGKAYCDLTGEVPWVRTTIDAYHERAQQTGARIVHCCGFDSIPSDLGCFLVQTEMQARYGEPASEVTFLLGKSKGGASGGTIASMLVMAEQVQTDKRTARLLAEPYALVPDHELLPPLPDQRGARWDEDFQTWTAPFFMATVNTRVVHRTNVLLGYKYGRGFRYQESIQMPANTLGRLAATGVSGGMGFFLALVAFAPTRRFLTATILPAPGDGPSKTARDNGYYQITFLGKNKQGTVKVNVAGDKDPGYGDTARMLSEAALCLALDRDALPPHVGILTPAAAMGMTLVNRLRRAGMVLEVI